MKTAQSNLELSEELLANQAGADHEVHFCSQCEREFMKEGTCPHCKLPLKSGFEPGAKRPPVVF